MVQPLWKTVWNLRRKLKIELLFDPAIPMLGLYPKNPETPIQKKLCTPMFTAAQFTISEMFLKLTFFQIVFWVSLDIFPELELLGHKEVPFLIF